MVELPEYIDLNPQLSQDQVWSICNTQYKFSIQEDGVSSIATATSVANYYLLFKNQHFRYMYKKRGINPDTIQWPSETVLDNLDKAEASALTITLNKSMTQQFQRLNIGNFYSNVSENWRTQLRLNILKEACLSRLLANYTTLVKLTDLSNTEFDEDLVGFKDLLKTRSQQIQKTITRKTVVPQKEELAENVYQKRPVPPSSSQTIIESTQQPSQNVYRLQRPLNK
jgi:hypothetical protein